MRFKYKEQNGFCFFMKKISGNLCKSAAKDCGKRIAFKKNQRESA
jgi:hypothetical protein